MGYSVCLENAAGVPLFILLGFHDVPKLKPALFMPFCFIYLLTVTGNVLVVVTVSASTHLHSPMYIFLGNLLFLEIWYPTTSVPDMLVGLLTGGCHVSFSGCISQFYFFGSFLTTEYFLLTLMACDRYVAICFHYIIAHLLTKGFALNLWKLVGQLDICPPYLPLAFCTHCIEKEIDHFFCDFEPLMQAACSDTSLVQEVAFFMSVIVLVIPFLLIFVTYVYIVSTILRIPSTSGRSIAFSTCSSHLTIVIMFFETLIALYATPATGQSINLNKALSLLYTVATPLLNPIIYTLRNKTFIATFRKTLFKKVCISELTFKLFNTNT